MYKPLKILTVLSVAINVCDPAINAINAAVNRL